MSETNSVAISVTNKKGQEMSFLSMDKCQLECPTFSSLIFLTASTNLPKSLFEKYIHYIK